VYVVLSRSGLLSLIVSVRPSTWYTGRLSNGGDTSVCGKPVSFINSLNVIFILSVAKWVDLFGGEECFSSGGFSSFAPPCGVLSWAQRLSVMPANSSITNLVIPL
jgi:hypothetical protein